MVLYGIFTSDSISAVSLSLYVGDLLECTTDNLGGYDLLARPVIRSLTCTNTKIDHGTIL
jgi:hypothetical protein